LIFHQSPLSKTVIVQMPFANEEPVQLWQSMFPQQVAHQVLHCASVWPCPTYFISISSSGLPRQAADRQLIAMGNEELGSGVSHPILRKGRR
jgi:hypothetical protein